MVQASRVTCCLNKSHLSLCSVFYGELVKTGNGNMCILLNLVDCNTQVCVCVYTLYSCVSPCVLLIQTEYGHVNADANNGNPDRRATSTNLVVLCWQFQRRG